MLRGPGPLQRGRLRHQPARLAGGGRDPDRGGHSRRSPARPSRRRWSRSGGGAVLGISHDGGTWATVEALEAARRAGARTGLITARGDARASEQADAVLVTPVVDRSWCHTVGYTSPITAALALAAAPDAGVVGDLIAAGVARRAAAGRDGGGAGRLRAADRGRLRRRPHRRPRADPEDRGGLPPAHLDARRGDVPARTPARLRRHHRAGADRARPPPRRAAARPRPDAASRSPAGSACAPP